MSVPLYSSDLALLDVISEKRALRLEDCGLAKVVRHKGHINRVVFYRRPDDPLPPTARDYLGKAYSFEQPLADGHHCWKLRPLQGGRSDSTLAPPETRGAFLSVVRGCMAQPATAPGDSRDLTLKAAAAGRMAAQSA
jgi:hypothetical protein